MFPSTYHYKNQVILSINPPARAKENKHEKPSIKKDQETLQKWVFQKKKLNEVHI